MKIVREKMLRTEAFSHPEQLQAFLSQLYVYLVDQMHLALNMVTSPPSPTLPHSAPLSQPVAGIIVPAVLPSPPFPPLLSCTFSPPVLPFISLV